MKTNLNEIGMQVNSLATSFGQTLKKGITKYALMPGEAIEKWFSTHETILLGGSLGFLYAGPLGLFLGGWLGYYVNHKINQATYVVNQVVETVKPVTMPFTIANKTAKGVWQGIKSTYTKATEMLSSPDSEEIARSEPVLLPSVQAEIVQDLAPQPKSKPKSKRAKESSAPGLVAVAGDFFDLMHGHASDQVLARNEDSWMTRDIFEVASDAAGSIKSNVSWLWSKLRANSVESEPAEKEAKGVAMKL